MSGRRFVLRAVKLGIPVAIVNDGPTRGDEYATVTVPGALGEVLPRLVELVLHPAGAGSATYQGAGS
jgi:hypothetical protein